MLFLGFSVSTYGSMSFAVPHRADPYSSLSQKFFLFFFLKCRNIFMAAAVINPAVKSAIFKLGTGFENDLFISVSISDVNPLIL